MLIALLAREPREAVFDICLVIGLFVFPPILAGYYPTDALPGTYDWIGGLWFSHVANDLLCLGLLVRRRCAPGPP